MKNGRGAAQRVFNFLSCSCSRPVWTRYLAPNFDFDLSYGRMNKTKPCVEASIIVSSRDHSPFHLQDPFLINVLCLCYCCSSACQDIVILRRSAQRVPTPEHQDPCAEISEKAPPEGSQPLCTGSPSDSRARPGILASLVSYGRSAAAALL